MTARPCGSAEWSSRDRSSTCPTASRSVSSSRTAKRETPVVFRGIVPDLFREGSGAVAEGRLEQGTFVADTILAKHDERYMPPELGNLAAEHKAGKTLEK